MEFFGDCKKKTSYLSYIRSQSKMMAEAKKSWPSVRHTWTRKAGECLMFAAASADATPEHATQVFVSVFRLEERISQSMRLWLEVCISFLRSGEMEDTSHFHNRLIYCRPKKHIAILVVIEMGSTDDRPPGLPLLLRHQLSR